jgi:hypothetical protein
LITVYSNGAIGSTVIAAFADTSNLVTSIPPLKRETVEENPPADTHVMEAFNSLEIPVWSDDEIPVAKRESELDPASPQLEPFDVSHRDNSDPVVASQRTEQLEQVVITECTTPPDVEKSPSERDGPEQEGLPFSESYPVKMESNPRNGTPSPNILDEMDSINKEDDKKIARKGEIMPFFQNEEKHLRSKEFLAPSTKKTLSQKNKHRAITKFQAEDDKNRKLPGKRDGNLFLSSLNKVLNQLNVNLNAKCKGNGEGNLKEVLPKLFDVAFELSQKVTLAASFFRFLNFIHRAKNYFLKKPLFRFERWFWTPKKRLLHDPMQFGKNCKTNSKHCRI